MTRPRPASKALRPLNEVIANGREDQQPAPGFTANLHGEYVEVTAVLTRTAVVASIHDHTADKRLVLLADLLVDPGVIAWRPKPPTGFSTKGRGRYTRQSS